MARPAPNSTAMKATAPFTPMAPDGSGRRRVRSTWASKSRSKMSLRVQPAARITNAPAVKSTISSRLGRPSEARPMAQRQGQSRSHTPTG